MIALLKAAWACLCGNRLALILAAVIAVAVLVGLAWWRGDSAGYDRAKDKYEARISDLVRDYATAEAEVERKARLRLEAEQNRTAAIEHQYLAERRDLQSRIRTITNRRIADAARPVSAAPGGVCLAGPEFVGLWNEALGLGRAPGGPSPAAAAAPGEAGGPSAPYPGIPGSGGAVTLGDILANHRDNAARCRGIEAQLAALIAWAQGLAPAARPANEGGDGRN